MIDKKNKSPPVDMTGEFLMIAKVFGAAIAGFLLLGAFFAPGQSGAILYSLLLLINICLFTLILTGIVLLLIVLLGRFFRLF